MNEKELSIKDKICFKIVELMPGDIYDVESCEIITVVSGELQDRVKGRLKTFESSVYYTGTIEAMVSTVFAVIEIKNCDIVLNKIDVEKEFGEYCRKNWSQLKDLTGVNGHEKVDLYRSFQIEYKFMGINYKGNLWFCGKNVDCLFHNEHDFIEIHTCIAGDGFMQKSIDGTVNTLVETVGLLPGTSHKRFDIDGEFEQNGNPRYPFHRWLGGNTGNIWLVIEKY